MLWPLKPYALARNKGLENFLGTILPCYRKRWVASATGRGPLHLHCLPVRAGAPSVLHDTKEFRWVLVY